MRLEPRKADTAPGARQADAQSKAQRIDLYAGGHSAPTPGWRWTRVRRPPLAPAGWRRSFAL